MVAFITATLLGPLFLIIAWYIHFHFNRARLYKLASEFNGPPTLPLIGNALKCWVPLTEAINVIRSIPSYYKSPARFWLGPYLIVHIWDPEDLQIVLNSSHALEKEPFTYGMVEMVTRRGLGTAPVEEWRRHRKIMGPIFNQKYLDAFFDIFQRHSNKLIHTLNDAVGNGVFDAQNNLATYSMGSLLDTLLEFDDNDSLNNCPTLANGVHTMLYAITSRLTNIWYFNDFIFNLSPIGRRLRSLKKEYDALMNVIIQKWETSSMEKLIKNNNRGDNKDQHKPTKLIEHLLCASDGSGRLTTEELRGEINTIMVAGLETTTTLLGFTLIMLGLHKNVQEKAYEEIKQVLGTKEELEHSDLKQLLYLEQVVKETLRLFPPMLVGMRRSSDQEIQLKNHTIPINTNITFGISNVHQNPDIWPNPDRFDPDRFLPEEEVKRHPYSWIPFSAGPRNCIGTRYAWISAKTVLANLLLKYKITTDYKSVEDVHLTFTISMQPTNGFRIGISAR